MYLKINFLGQTKKVMLKDDLRTEAGFFELLGRLTKLPRDDLAVTFVDLENDTVPILDQFDLDYFLTDAGKSNFLSVTVAPRVPDSMKVSVRLEDSMLSTFQQPAKPTAEMNIQTDRVPTTERCSETQSCLLSNNGQQVCIPVAQDTKDTQTKVPETVDQQVGTQGVPSAESRLLERIEALEKSFFSQQSASLQAKPQAEATPQVAKSVVTTAHVGITCDSCSKKNFVGKRFKCLVCPDFDLCEACEAENTHQHPMVRCSAIADTLLLEKMRRKYNKFSARGYRFPPRDGPASLDRCLRAAREMMGKAREEGHHGHGHSHAHPWFFRGAPAESQKISDEKEKRDILRFMLPNAEEHWETILTKWGHLPILEFCAVLNTWEAPAN